MTPQEEALAQAIAAHQSRLTGTMHGCGPECSLAILAALPEGAYLVVPPPHTRLILAAEDLLSTFGTRTAEGFAITAEWGEQESEGWYEPRFTAHSDDDLAATQREHGAQQERERLRARHRDGMRTVAQEIPNPERSYMDIYVSALLADPEDDR